MEQAEIIVSTHSRPKAAGPPFAAGTKPTAEFQHTAARRRLVISSLNGSRAMPFQHTAARRRLGSNSITHHQAMKFQHTAARRRLGCYLLGANGIKKVSTHSRPKAAGRLQLRAGLRIAVSTHSRPKAAGCGRCCRRVCRRGFNTQPPEGGWVSESVVLRQS